ncbi:HNH nuclease [uncultured Caudovirales phage]|uniref:HNH nuclease n=1 Tax=uncultured Caudovirales phage TaxID=2100421 RepID=A0A6J5LLD9_9CAUD|nr:HNH nuclease [uncultured Caudovirales phage]
MKVCLRCFELKEMFHGRDCKECRKKYLNQKWLERNSKTCPICKIEHNFGNCIECSDKCKILNRHKKINGCWEWKGKLSQDGYGSFQKVIDGKKTEIAAHRRSYEIFKGEIPEGMQVCHSCDNARCCNPDHLWIGTPRDNTQDCIKKGRRSPEKNRAIAAGKLTEDEVREIRELYKNGSSQKELQEKFKISQSQVSGILTYRFWRHVT